MAAKIVRVGLHFDVIVFPPDIDKHLRRRGFDHMRVLAQSLAQLLGCELCDQVKRHGKAMQVGQNKAKRAANVRGQFELAGVIDPNKKYLVVDDVWTTGATMRELIKELRKSGAKNISIAVIAKA